MATSLGGGRVAMATRRGALLSGKKPPIDQPVRQSQRSLPPTLSFRAGRLSPPPPPPPPPPSASACQWLD